MAIYSYNTKHFASVWGLSLDDYIKNITETVQNGIPFSVVYDFSFHKNNETYSSNITRGVLISP